MSVSVRGLEISADRKRVKIHGLFVVPPLGRFFLFVVPPLGRFFLFVVPPLGRFFLFVVPPLGGPCEIREL
ncbi:Uncharacterized protein dnm_055900 [Desulfonema magnum]|uniref:Uncharacterized protein n=1 Tax=Desulfonema magnum TaxID=45655 RepID=A0A975GQ60_9BACT|nr:Uncharacterized protein dnm_055900 [Desulfonema magnum]